MAATAAKTYMELTPEEQRIESILALAMDENPYEPDINIYLKNLLPTPSIKFKEDLVMGQLFLWNIQEGAPASPSYSPLEEPALPLGSLCRRWRATRHSQESSLQSYPGLYRQSPQTHILLRSH
jgi:hypothetical protein